MATEATRAIALSCMVCAGASLWWRRRRRHRDVTYDGHRGAHDDDDDDDVGCDDPNCLRCHSSSPRHLSEFQNNAILLRRLVRLEPRLFEGMRTEILDAVDDAIAMTNATRWGGGGSTTMNDGRRRRSRSGESSTSWSSSLSMSQLARVLDDAMERLPRIASRTAPSATSRASDTTTTANGGCLGSAMAPPTTSTKFSPQPGQRPTVFFLPGLEATPLHDCIAKRPSIDCPCSRIWKMHVEETGYNRPSIRGIIPDRKIQRPPVRGRMGGDLEALKNGFDAIRRELLEYLLLSDGSNGHRDDPFRPFDSKVYTSANGNANPDGMMESDSARRRHRPQQQPEWSSIYLYDRGIVQTRYRTHFPKSLDILETQCPHRMAGKCGFGSVYFSKLGRNTKVKEHCGPTNVRLRCHLPLIVPSPPKDGSRRSLLVVGLADVNEERLEWEEGRPVLFDDSFLHSATHHGDDCFGDDDADDDDDVSEEACVVGDRAHGDSLSNLRGARIVLIVDFWHPSLSESDRNALGVLYPPGS